MRSHTPQPLRIAYVNPRLHEAPTPMLPPPGFCKLPEEIRVRLADAMRRLPKRGADSLDDWSALFPEARHYLRAFSRSLTVRAPRAEKAD